MAIERFMVERIQEFAEDQAVPPWETLLADEQASLIQRLIRRVDYDGAQGKVAITFHSTSGAGQNGAAHRKRRTGDDEDSDRRV
jgi:hypothetical protein